MRPWRLLMALTNGRPVRASGRDVASSRPAGASPTVSSLNTLTDFEMYIVRKNDGEVAFNYLVGDSVAQL